MLINEFTIFGDRSIGFDISYCKENNMPHIIFNDIECVFRRSGVFSYLIFCETEKKNKKMLDKYTKIIDQIKEEILFIVEDVDEDENKEFIIGKYFMRFRFATSNDLSYNQEINAKVCVISISSIFKERNWYYPQIELQECFYESSQN